MRCLLTVVLALSLSSLCSAATIHVPANQPTIQAGIDAAIDGDTVLVAEGHYYERISYLGKAITVASEFLLDSDTTHIANTIIDGDTAVIPIVGGIDNVVRFVTGEDTTSVLTGLTIQNGTNTVGGAVSTNYGSASPKVTNCIIKNNSGGLALYGGGIVHKCVLSNNGPGFGIIGTTMSVTDCEFRGNAAGLRFRTGNARVINSRFVSNVLGVRATQPSMGDSIIGCVFDSNGTGIGYGGPPPGGVSEATIESDSDNYLSAIKDEKAAAYASDTYVFGCTFRNNGMALFGQDQRSYVDSCVFDANTKVIQSIDLFLTLRRCVIRGTIEDAVRVSTWNTGDNLLESNVLEGNKKIALICTRGTISNCSFISNSSQQGNPIDRVGIKGPLVIENTIFAFNGGSGPIKCAIDTGSTLTISCTDSYGNAGGDWNGCMAPFGNINGNMSANPFFCDTAAGDYRVMEFSYCAPANNSCNTQIGAYGVGCIGTPAALGLVVLNQANQNVIGHLPKFSWIYSTPIPNPEDSFEVQVGTDNDWAVAEMWGPGVSNGPDTSVTYAGSTLMDGATYQVRVRVHNGLTWSPWFSTNFRMNSLASVPIASRPIGGVTLSTPSPALYLYNSIDAEGDQIQYDFEVYLDTLSGSPIASTFGEIEQADSTGWTVTPALSDNNRYFWRARAFDGYEYSAWSPFASFWVNLVEQAPSSFYVLSPSGGDTAQTYDIPPTFNWGASIDPDPRDSVYYTLRIGLDSFFLFYSTIDSIYTTQHQVNGLQFGWHYWWKAAAHDTKGNITWSSNVAHLRMWVLGDANADGSTNIGDAVFLINLVFKFGTRPDPNKIGDANGDCMVNVADAVYLINHIFKGGLAPKVGCAEGK